MRPEELPAGWCRDWSDVDAEMPGSVWRRTWRRGRDSGISLATATYLRITPADLSLTALAYLAAKTKWKRQS